jgi:hypothetical protein
LFPVTPVPCLPAAGRSPTTALIRAYGLPSFLPSRCIHPSIDFDRWTKGNRQHDVSSRVLCVVSHSHGAGPTHVRRLQFRRSEVNARCPCHVALVSETFRLNAASFLAFRAEEFVVLGRQTCSRASGILAKEKRLRESGDLLVGSALVSWFDRVTNVGRGGVARQAYKSRWLRACRRARSIG